jgi:hypothetical protein
MPNPDGRTSELDHFLDPFPDKPWAVLGGGLKSEERKCGLLKQLIEQLIPQTAVRPLMGRIIEFNGCNGSKVLRLGQDKIDMLARDRTKDAVPCGSACAGNNKQIGDSNFGEDQESSIDCRIERLVKLLFRRGKQSFDRFNVDRWPKKSPDYPEQ